MNNLPKIRKFVNLLIQLAIFVLTCLFIYFKVFKKTDLPGFIRLVDDELSSPGFQNSLWLVLFMMLINWGLEAWKWRYLIGKLEHVSFLRACLAVLAGISISSVIPNRVGEFFGRVFILKTAGRIESILITLVGSVSQLLITVFAGSAALLLFIPQYLPVSFYNHGYIYYCIVAIVITLDVILLAIYFQISFLTTLKERLLKNGFKRFRKFFRVFAFFHNRELATVLLLSFSRYLVFSTQFSLLLGLFGVAIPYLHAMMMIALIYLIMAIIPTIALTELGIRGSVALYIFGLYFDRFNISSGQHDAAIFAASTLLWMINVGIPALLGTVFVFRLQFFRKTVL